MKTEDLDRKNNSHLCFTIDIENSSTEIIRKTNNVPNLEKLKKKRTPPTAEELQKKLDEAENRRKSRLERKSKRAAESRTQMLELAEKLDKLNVHHQLAARGTMNIPASEKDKVLSKREYTMLASSVSMQFENLSQRYTRDLITANDFLQHVKKEPMIIFP